MLLAIKPIEVQSKEPIRPVGYSDGGKTTPATINIRNCQIGSSIGTIPCSSQPTDARVLRAHSLFFSFSFFPSLLLFASLLFFSYLLFSSLLFSSLLFSSFLFFSLLFSSILFSTILFYSILFSSLLFSSLLLLSTIL
jgi:hypothetical protein